MTIVVVAVVKFMGKQIQNSNSGKQKDICGEKTQKNILSSRWELSPRPSMGYMYKQAQLFCC